METTQKLFGYFQNIVGVATVPQAILFLQTVLSAHHNPQLVQILQSRFGIAIVQNLLKRGYDLGLHIFSKDLQFAAPGSPGFHWYAISFIVIIILITLFMSVAIFINKYCVDEQYYYILLIINIMMVNLRIY